ncbi:MAG: hypothetical protein DKM50_04500 [Candidatus Margulisiibacteriota bacterium]|nr:MAG: hypothetical protein A2X43_05640 [Candidatus Margulisbacteria bacterium GWD2_39_127]OGI01037.1 MAG: hypothetical protein A2X42_12280 [Candidatus Margulisbacteria bacterium GWF2_38_17]OGI09566.1 MAG: hypothetical protein A2X41_06485 [Candidatus Margulisbacteria bacterium GWE2_39_32]PZM82011.1 MAG: hypothetical protein DKM50_04500 [Candidatus Margulisiibacteriota bacterium]HCY35868.1 hypothetical protein [Candidatus Margulisiibacteriota bacterium]
MMQASVVLIFSMIVLSNYVYANEKTIEIASNSLQRTEYKYKLLMDNMVNAKTPGYREVSAKDEMTRRGDVESSSYYNYSQGEFIHTSRKFDVAIEGKGFFTVATKEGTLLYTRDGRFTLDSENRLCTYSQNFLVMGELGPIIINEPDNTSITETGKIVKEDFVVDKLKISSFKDLTVLAPANGSFFYVKYDNYSTIDFAEDSKLKIGYIEGPNTNLSRQLSDIAQVQKKYDADSRVIQFRLKSMSSSLEMGKIQ